MRITRFLLVLVFLFSAFWVEAQNETRPKIGLVLSGGGAKGIAHVGIIKAMEQAGLKADYVVGTSMGSVVGGLYALGYSASEMEEIIRGIDWDLVLSNRVSFEDISFEEKEYYNRYLLEFPVRGTKISFPSGLIEGQSLSDVLHYYTWPSVAYESFDEFPIPFRCVATDISTGKPVIFDSGYLHDALRSSIAIPTAFTPFELDDTSVVDGGVVNNYPVDVVREMGADIVIGVNVSDEDFAKAEDLDSFAAILMQLAMSESLRKTSDNIAQTNIYIKPDLGPYSTGSFGDYEAILELGDKAGQAFIERFDVLSEEIGMNETEFGIGLEVDSVRLNSINIQGNNLISKDLIRSKFSLNEGETVTRDEVKYGIDMVFGVNAFYKVDYAIDQAEQGYDLTISVKEKPATLLSTSIHYDNRFGPGILLNFTARDWIGKLSRSVFLLDISENPKFRFDYYKYTGQAKKVAFNARFNFLNTELFRYEEGSVAEVFGERNIRIETNFLTTSSLRQSFAVGLRTEISRSRTKINVTIPEDIKSGTQGFLGVKASYYRNSQNDRNFPTRGAEAFIEPVWHVTDWTRVSLENDVDSVFLDFGDDQIGIAADDFEEFAKSLAPDPHVTVYGRYSKFLELGKRIQFKPDMAFGVTLGTSSNFRSYNDFFVGGIQNLRFIDTPTWGLNYGEVTTPNFLKVGAGFQFIPIKKIYLRAGANWLGYSDYLPFNDERFPDQIFQDETLLGYGVDISYQSIIGPITLGISSNSEDKAVRTHFALGFSFAYSDR